MPHRSAAPPLDTPFPPLLGSPGFAQGRYGARGNFELVVPDPHDGLWVFWHNNDPAASGTAPVPGPPPGAWSGGLHFAAGHRYTSAAVVQSVHGPDHLELLAGDGTAVHRWRWSPERAFTHEGTLPVRAAGAPALAEGADGVLFAAVPLPDGGVARCAARPRDYPELDWEVTEAHRAPSSAVVSAAVVAGGAFATEPAVIATAGDGSLLVWHGGGPGRIIGSVAAPAHVTALAMGDTLRCYAVGDDAVLRVVDGDGRRWADVPLPGAGRIRGLAVTAVSYDSDRTELAVQRGDGILHLVQDGGPDGAWEIGEARSRVLPGPGVPEGVHRRG
ncbi:hypothetical protein [Streptomyces sp. NPDC058486]|uniref:hypothetical protein n=1 Tax=unclassified Streptomyces TaxID=2593676 RepID=UPI003667DB36